MDNIRKIKRICVNGVWIAIKFKRDPKVSGVRVHGYYSSSDSEIGLCSKLSGTRLRMILCHELAHAAVHLSGHSEILEVMSMSAGTRTVPPSLRKGRLARRKSAILDIEEILAVVVESQLYQLMTFTRDNPNIEWRA